MIFFLKGLIIGFSIAAPVGAIGTLCIRRSLTNGRLSGFLTGLGAATADGFYGAVAAFGLTIVLNPLASIQVPLQLIGGLFLLYLAQQTYFAEVKEFKTSTSDRKSLLGDYFSTVVLTLMNPSTIFSFIAVFGGIGMQGLNGDFLSATALTVGVFIGSSVWWLFLSTVVSLLRKRVGTRFLTGVNVASAGLLSLFGLIALAGFMQSILSTVI